MSKKFRVRVNKSSAYGQKTTAIPKGGSSSSNPKTNLHRVAANNARILKKMPLIAVDEKAVNSHSDELIKSLELNSMTLDVSKDDKKDEIISIAESVARTDFTHFTNCTNPTFNPVHREWKSGSKLHAEVVMVLAAVAEVIQQNGGTETDVEYFGALLSSLQNTPSSEFSKVAAIAYLLHLNARKISKPVLLKLFSQSSKIITTKMNGMAFNSNEFTSTALKFLISTLGCFLNVLPHSAWEYMENKNIIALILHFSVEEHPWIRTISRRIIRNLLTDPLRCAEGVHPASRFVGELVLQALQKPSDTKQQQALTTRYLCLLEGLLHKMPKTIFRQLAEHILNLGSSSDQMVKCAAFQCIQKTLLQHPGENCLPVDTNIELIHVLRSLKTPSDISVCAYWLKALVEAHVCLAPREEQMSVELLNETMQICAQLLNWKSSALSETVFSSSLRLITCCVQQNSKAAIVFLDHLHGSLSERVAADKSAKGSLEWTLKTVAGLLEESQSSIVGDCFTKVLRKLAEMRDNDACNCPNSIDDVFSSAIRHVGLEPVLEAVPLTLFTPNQIASVDFKRSWLLPLLPRSVKNASLAYYMNYFVPLAMNLHEHQTTLPQLQAKLCATAEAQIWSLLPKVLDSNPSDFQEAFPSLCPILGAVLNERSDLRMPVLEALRATLKHSSSCDAAKEIMESKAKNFLPILFGIYTSSVTTFINGEKKLLCLGRDDQSTKLATLETIRLYVGATPSTLISSYIQHAVEKVQEADNSLHKKALIMDILIAMSKGANTNSLFMIIEAIKDWFSSSDAQMQKKAYRLLAEIYRRTNDLSLNEFFAVNIHLVNQLIRSGSAQVAACAWPWRIATYRSVTCSLTDLVTLQQFCDLTFPEIVAYLDRQNSKPTRHQASKLIQEMAVQLIAVGSQKEETPSNMLGLLLNKLFVIQQDNPSDLLLLKCHVTALTLIAQRHLRLMNGCLMSRVVSFAVWSWNVSPDVTALSSRLLRILCIRLPGYALEQYKEIILNAVFLAKPTRTSAARKANVILLDAFLDKFGIETLVHCANKQIDWIKQLKNLEKRRRRREGKKQRVMVKIEDEDMEEVEDLEQEEEKGNSEVSDNFIIK